MDLGCLVRINFHILAEVALFLCVTDTTAIFLAYGSINNDFLLRNELLHADILLMVV